jgi:hypothetical protein
MNTVKTIGIQTVNATDDVAGVPTNRVTDVDLRQIMIEVLEQLKIMNLHLSIITDHEILIEEDIL